MFGATKTFGPQKGLTDPDIIRVDGILNQWVVAICGSTPAERRLADAKGAGAAGGLGFALMLLGGIVVSGIDLVTDAVGLTELAMTHDLVVTGEGTYDFSSRSGKAVYGVATVAAAAARPCIVLAGQVSVADGTDLAAEKLERVLTNDPGMGVIRHVDAGYDRAIEVADERGVTIPMKTEATS